MNQKEREKKNTGKDIFMERVEDLVPKNKFDFSGIEKLRMLSDEEITPIE